MTTREDAIRAMREMLGKKTDKTFTRFALTGDGTGADNCDVDGRNGWIWVRFDEDQSKVSQVFSEYRGLPEDVPVIVGKLFPEAEYPQVLAINWPLYYNAMSSVDFDSFLLPRHGQAHGEDGADRVPVGMRNIEPGKVRETDPVSLSVYAQRFYYTYAGTLSQWPGNTLDLTASVPAAAGHRYTLVSLTIETNTLNTTDGTVVDLPITPDIPSIPDGDIPLAVVDLAQGETTIENADIFDMRLLWNGAGIVENHTHSGDGDGGASIVCLEELFVEDIPISLDGSTLFPYGIYHTVYVPGLYASGDQVLEYIQPDISYAGTCPQLLIIRPGPFGLYDTYSITVKHNAGNIWLSNENDVVLSRETDHLMLIYNGEYWCDFCVPCSAEIQQFVTVAKSGGDFATIQGAIDSITDATTNRRYCVLIYPGDYAETVVGKDFVELMGLAAREAVNITGAVGPLYTFPDREGHIFNLKFSLTPTTGGQEIISVPATVGARQIVNNCLFVSACASDANTAIFDVNGGEIEFRNNKVVMTNTYTGGGAIRTQRVFDIDGNAIVDVQGNIVDVAIYDVNDRIIFFDDASLIGGDVHIVQNIIHLISYNAGAYSGIVRALNFVSTVGHIHSHSNTIKLTSFETGGTGRGEYVRINSAAGGGIVDSTSNHLLVEDFATNYWANVAAGDEIVSHFDDIVAVDGQIGAGTFTYINSQADGELDVSGDSFLIGTVDTGAGRIVKTTRVAAAYTALVTDHVIFADSDGGAFTVDLPAGVDGQYFRIVNCGSSGNDVTIDGDGGELVRGALTQTISDGEIMILVYEPTEEWW